MVQPKCKPKKRSPKQQRESAVTGQAVSNQIGKQQPAVPRRGGKKQTLKQRSPPNKSQQATGRNRPTSTHKGKLPPTQKGAANDVDPTSPVSSDIKTQLVILNNIYQLSDDIQNYIVKLQSINQINQINEEIIDKADEQIAIFRQRLNAIMDRIRAIPQMQQPTFDNAAMLTYERNQNPRSKLQALNSLVGKLAEQLQSHLKQQYPDYNWQGGSTRKTLRRSTRKQPLKKYHPK